MNATRSLAPIPFSRITLLVLDWRRADTRVQVLGDAPADVLDVENYRDVLATEGAACGQRRAIADELRGAGHGLLVKKAIRFLLTFSLLSVLL